MILHMSARDTLGSSLSPRQWGVGSRISVALCLRSCLSNRCLEACFLALDLPESYLCSSQDKMVFSTSASSSTFPNVSNPRWKTWLHDTFPLQSLSLSLTHTQEPELPVLCIPTTHNDTSLPYHLSHCVTMNCFLSLSLPAPTYTLQIENIF